jgi:DNA-binding NarL/FixJ family response regulator
MPNRRNALMSSNGSQESIGGAHKNGSASPATGRTAGPQKAARARTLTTVLLDRDPIWSQAIEQVLRRLHIKVAGKANSPERALALIAEHEPDLLIAELEIGDSEMEGIACLRQARARAPDLRMIVFSRSDDREHILAAFTAGALAYIHKKTHPDDLAMAIRQLVFEHSVYFAEYRVSNPQTQTPLSRRETEILQLVAEGLSTADMARRLWVTRQTVKFHLGNIYRKIGVSNRTAAARWAYDQGLLIEEGTNHEPSS